MPFTQGGKHYSLRAKRLCRNCKVITDKTAVSCRYRAPPEPKVPQVYIRELEWYCEGCDQIEVEKKEIVEPTDKTRIFRRLQSIAEDYDIISMNIRSLPNEIVFRIRLPDFDMGEIRAIQTKATETGFINVSELMKLQKAGYRRPVEIPPKPQPKDRQVLRERARRKIFVGEPRSI
jgi:hypothetical protein